MHLALTLGMPHMHNNKTPGFLFSGRYPNTCTNNNKKHLGSPNVNFSKSPWHIDGIKWTSVFYPEMCLEGNALETSTFQQGQNVGKFVKQQSLVRTDSHFDMVLWLKIESVMGSWKSLFYSVGYKLLALNTPVVATSCLPQKSGGGGKKGKKRKLEEKTGGILSATAALTGGQNGGVPPPNRSDWIAELMEKHKDVRIIQRLTVIFYDVNHLQTVVSACLSSRSWI